MSAVVDRAVNNDGRVAVPAHGGCLVERVLKEPEAEKAARQLAARGVGISLDDLRRSDLVMLAMGAFSPLDGFMDRENYLSVLEHMRLVNGVLWPLPVVLPVPEAVARSLEPGSLVPLTYRGEVKGLIEVRESYQRSLVGEALAVFRTLSPAHPGVARLMGESEWLVAGRVELVVPPGWGKGRVPYLTPAEARREFARRGWETIVGFQTRNPIHRAHEYLIRAALEVMDGLFLSPVMGPTKGDDVPAEIRWRCYEVLLAEYLPPERVVLCGLDLAMRYAGPREALFHAIIRQNFGCTHFIIGRDHAGVGDFYGPIEAQRIFRQLRPADLAIKPLFFDAAFYCRRCGSLATSRTCPHGPAAHLSLSGTQLRELLSDGKLPPAELVRPEVAAVLMEAYWPGAGLGL